MNSRVKRLQQILLMMQPMEVVIAVKESDGCWRINDIEQVFYDEEDLDLYIEHRGYTVVKIRII